MPNSANSLNIKSAGIPVFDGVATFTESTTTQYNVLVGGTANSIQNVAPSAASGIPLISGGSAANPSFGTALVAGGGTGAITLTSNGVLLGNGTSAVTATAAGTTGQILTGVTGSAPTFQSPAASSISLTGDSGGSLTGAAFTLTGGTTGLLFAGSGSTESLGCDLVVANGGTGNTTFTPYSVITAGTTATGAFQNVSGVGTLGQVLTSNGSGAVPSWQSGGGLVYIAKQTASSSSTISFTSAITSTYNTYLIIWSNLTPSTTADLHMLVSTNNGSSYISSGYQSGLYFLEFNSATFTNDNSTTYVWLTANSPSGQYASGQLWLTNLLNGTPFQCWGEGNFRAAGNCYRAMTVANCTATNVNAIQFSMSSGNITTGTFTLYGLLNS